MTCTCSGVNHEAVGIGIMRAIDAGSAAGDHPAAVAWLCDAAYLESGQ
jgi:hypothetical protein